MTRLRSARTIWLAVTLGAALLAATGSSWAGQPEPGTPAAQPGAHQAAAEGEAGAEGGQHEGGGLLKDIARLFNFGLLAGTLVYFLRSPIATYLVNRKTQIRSDLVKADGLRQSAASQIAEIERRMVALPAELDALRKEGAQEVAAEEARLREAANAERSRLLDQARREIEAQVRLAERDLVKHAADLAVALAAERIKGSITFGDQLRLIDRYLVQVGRQGRES